jgi:Membrane carboxypeptidase (penicillin-binding protein)
MKKEKQAVEFFFKWVYLFLSFFVFIGEGVRFIFLWVFWQAFYLLRLTFHLLIKIFAFILKLIGRWFFLLKSFLSQIPFKLYYFILGSMVTLTFVFLYQGYLFVKNLPSPSVIGKVNFPLSTHLYDRNGKLLYEIYREENRTPIKLKDLPPFVYQATIAIEDKDFYKHQGVSFWAILRAIKKTFLENNLQGGSTITQQLVKASLLTPERTWQRKIKEIILALWTEKIYTKDQILEMYLNQVPYGGSAYGVEEAAKIYFGKSAKDLNLEEAALLAGLPQAPSVYSPYINPNLARKGEMRFWRRCIFKNI